MLTILSCFIFVLFSMQATIQIPDWVKTEFNQLTRNQGIWRCENNKYKSKNEPYDAYALKWTYVIGKHAITGEMVVIKDQKVLGKLWQFHMYWDPLKKQLITTQFGSDGTTGIGYQTKKSNRVAQKFFNPDGSTYEVGHESKFDEKGHHTTSFTIINSVWQKRRYYLWKNVNSYL